MKKKTVTLRFNSLLMEKLEKLAGEDKRSLNNYLELILSEAVFNGCTAKKKQKPKSK